MFCPHCAAKNDDDVKFCRGCGENLILVNQVMKGHVPIALIGKIDTVLDTGYERLRRDAILWFLWAVVWSILFVVKLNWRVLTYPEGLAFVFIVALIPAALMYTLAGWNFLLFRRAKKMVFSAASPVNPDLDLPFCPRCGIEHAGPTDFCSNCGFDLTMLMPRERRTP